MSEKLKSTSDQLADLAKSAAYLVRTARRNRKALGGDNHYANKLVMLRAEAANLVKALSGGGGAGSGDVTALVELVDVVFSASVDQTQRAAALKELIYELKTKWTDSPPTGVGDSLVPLSILTATKRSYLIKIAVQANGAYEHGWYDASAVMMRRLLETCIIEAFEGKKLAAKIKDSHNNYFQLTDLVASTVKETSWTLTRNSKEALPKLKNLGHLSAHSRFFTADKSDVDNVRLDFRVVIQELLTHAGLS